MTRPCAWPAEAEALIARQEALARERPEPLRVALPEGGLLEAALRALPRRLTRRARK